MKNKEQEYFACKFFFWYFVFWFLVYTSTI